MAIDILISTFGLLVVLAVTRDFIRTTIRLEGSGRFSGLLMSALWGAALRLHSRQGKRTFLSTAGVAILLISLFTWALLVWVGWLLFFLPHLGSIVASDTSAPADFWSNVYFVGYSLITLGVGDYVPASPVFQVATVVAAMNGFFLFTLSVTYLVPVVSAVVQARQLAAQIFLLGESPEEIADWLRRHGSLAVQQVNSLAAPIVLLSQHHFAYPVLTYFASYRRSNSIAVALAVLDEALNLLELQPADPAVDPDRLKPVRGAIARYLELHVAVTGEARPDGPGSAESSNEFDRIDHRRSLLRRLLELEGRTWSDVRVGSG